MLGMYILIVVLLIVANGWLAMSEMAVVSSHNVRLRERADRHLPGARAALQLAHDPGRFLSTVQVGITLVGVLTGAFGGAALAEPLGRWLSRFDWLAGSSQTLAFVIVVTATTYFTLIVGELVPKRVALRNPEWFAGLVARPMQWLSRLARPVVWLLECSTEGVLRCIGLHGGDERGITEAEVRAMIREGTHEGVFDPREQTMIEGLLRLDDRSARSVMVPRPKVAWLDINDDVSTIHDKIKSTGFSLFLVCDGEIDELAGVVRTHDLLDLLLCGEALNLSQCMVEPLVVPDSTSVIDLIDRFKSARMHMAVVVDEYGDLAGIATITDVLEVVTGNLPEHWELAVGGDAVQRDDGVWEVNGTMAVDDFEKALGLKGVGADAHYQTMAGFILSQMESMPSTGDCLDWNGICFEVMDMDGQRISKLKVALPGVGPPR